MSNVKISELPAATTPLDGTELVPIVQGGVTKRVATDAIGDTVLDEFAASNGSSLVGFLQSGSGATARTAQAKLRDVVSVKDFGAVGDGVTDDTVAIQAAVTYVVNRGGGAIVAPAGKYRISDTINFYTSAAPRGVSFSGESQVGGESAAGAGTIFEWHGANDRPVFKATGQAIRGLRFSGFLLCGAGPYGTPTNPYQDGFWVAPTSLYSAQKIIFENLWLRDYTRTGWMLGDPLNPSTVDPNSYNGQMANSAMYNCLGAGYGPDAKVIWAKGGTSEDFYVYNLCCLSVSGTDKKNYITTEAGFFMDIYGLLSTGIDDNPAYYAVVAKSSISIYQWITEDLRLYDTIAADYGHPIVLSGIRMLSSNARHGGIARDAIVWRGYKNTPAAWDAVPIMSLQGCALNNSVLITAGANQQQFSAVGVTFSQGGFSYAGTNQRVFAHDAVNGSLRMSGPSVSYEQLTQDGTSRFMVEKGALYLRRNTLADIGSDQNNYSIGTTGTYFRLTPIGANRTITGLADGADGRVVIIRNASATNTLIFANESASSTAANRIVTTNGFNLSIDPSRAVQLVYDSPSSRWIVLNSTDLYNVGTFQTSITCGTSGTVTLDSTADTLAYERIGNWVHVHGKIDVQSVSSPVGEFRIAMPFAIADLTEQSGNSVANVVINNSVAAKIADFVAIVAEGNSSISVYLGDATSLQSDSAQELQAGATIRLSVSYRTA